MNLTDIHAAIVGERRYQQKRWGTSSAEDFQGPYGPERRHEVASFITFIDDYLTEAKEVARQGGGNTAALGILRKSIALVAACFDQNEINWQDYTPEEFGATSVIEFITKMDNWLFIAKRSVTRAPNDLQALGLLGRLLRVGLAAFVQHGVPHRS